MERKPNSVITLNSPLNKKFFRMWLEFLKPFHKLTDRETDVLAAFLKERYYLSKKINDPELLDKILMNEDTKKKVREDCNYMSSTHFQVIMTKLRKSRIIVDGKISPKFIPKIDNEDNFQLLLLFNLK